MPGHPPTLRMAMKSVAAPNRLIRARWDGRLMAMLLRMSPLIALCNIGMAVFVCWLTVPALGWVPGLWWTAVLVLASVAYGGTSVAVCRRPIDVLGRPVVRHVFTGLVLLIALAYSGIAVELFPRLDADRRFLLGMLLCGGVPVGVVVVAPVRQVGLAYAVAATSGVAVALLRQRSFVYDTTVGLLALMGALLVFCVVVVEEGLRARLRAETEAQQERQAVDLLLQDFEAQANDWVWEADARGRLRRVAQRMAEALGRSDASELIGAHLVEVLAGRALPSHRSPELNRLHACLTRAVPFRGIDVQPVPLRPGEALMCWSVSGVPVSDEHDELVGWRGLVRDVTVVRAQARELQRMVHTDALTGLANRYAFQLACDEAAARQDGTPLPEAANDTDRLLPVSLHLLDLDNFKTVNDTFGPDLGDRLLQECAMRLALCVDERLATREVRLARMGGDEFALLVESPHTAAQRDELALALLAALRRPWFTEGLRIEVRASAGVASWEPENPACSSQRLLQNAGAALCEAKTTGRDRARVFDAQLGARVARRSTVIHELGRLLSPGRSEQDIEAVGRLAVHYQPQFDLQDGHLVGVEALARWLHPVHGWMSPAEFVPIAEATGLIRALGAWVLARACEDAARWPPSVRLAVNVSGAQLEGPALAERVAAILAATGLGPQRLEVEITETVLLTDPDHARACLGALRRLGVGVALDDFGTGYSSLAQLALLPVDKLKIDRSFITRLGRDPQADNIVAMIIQLGGTLGMTTMAEGVETREQHERLRACGCAGGQGYLYGPAIDADGVTVLLAELATGIDSPQASRSALA